MTKMALLIFFGVLSHPAFGSAEFIPIQERAQGQSLGGANLLNDSLFSNPAASSFTQVYAIDAMYSLPKSFAASVLDTKTSSVGGAIGYFRRGERNSDEVLQGFKIGMSSRLSSMIGAGLAGKWVWGTSAMGENSKSLDFDAGLLGNFDMLQLGVTLRNLAGGNVILKQEREWALGGRINYQQILFFSVTTMSKWANFKPYQYGFGAEYISPYHLSLKGGYRIQPDNKLSYWSAGATFISPKLSAHYAVEIPNQAGEALEHILGVTLVL